MWSQAGDPRVGSRNHLALPLIWKLDPDLPLDCRWLSGTMPSFALDCSLQEEARQLPVGPFGQLLLLTSMGWWFHSPEGSKDRGGESVFSTS